MQIRDILSRATEAGWDIEQLKSRHLRAKSPCGRFIIHVSGTPSDRRAVYKIRADFKRAGLAI